MSGRAPDKYRLPRTCTFCGAVFRGDDLFERHHVEAHPDSAIAKLHASLIRGVTVNYETPKCFGCGERTVITLDAAAFERWQAGAHLVEVFPTMPAPERELLLNGTHPACWDTGLGPNPDDDNDEENPDA